VELRLTGKLTAEDVAEIGRLVRPRWFWARILFRNLYSILILGGLLWVTVAGLVNGEKLNWGGIGAVWAIFAVLFAFLYFRALLARGKETSTIAAALPNWITIDATGLHFDGPNGANSFQPWVSYKGWREGKRTVVLEYAAHRGFAVLPTSGLSEPQRQILLGLLDSHLGVASKEAPNFDLSFA
jgi:hypothetical protein